ncbi:MAG: lmo0937 family membrane protein [Chthoniobacterales bacterium]
MLWTILIILIVLWALGLGFGIAGNLIHLILLIALIVLIVQLVTGRKAP